MIKRVDLLVITVFLYSCARIPYNQWNSSLENKESTIKAQKLEAAVIVNPDQKLFDGVIKTTRNRQLSPYPQLSVLMDTMIFSKKIILSGSEVALQKLRDFRIKYAEVSISAIGPENTDYTLILNELDQQLEINQSAIVKLLMTDQQFDSICSAQKIKAIPLSGLEFQIKYTSQELTNKLMALEENYDGIKRNITEQEDQNESMIKLNAMRQKLREIEAEIQEHSMLYSTLSPVLSNGLIYQGPAVETMADLMMVSEKESAVISSLKELEMMIEEY